MEITHRKFKRTDLLILTGNFESEEARQLQPTLNGLFALRRFNIVVDMAEVKSINAAGLLVLVRARKRAQEVTLANDERGDVRLANLPPNIKTLFDQLGFTRRFGIYDDCLEAVGSF